MAKGERAFWSSLPGVLTGLAGILTATVALLGLGLSQGWIGDEDPDEGDNGSGDDDTPVLSVDPPSITFRPAILGAVSQTVTIRNQSSTAVTLSSARLDGEHPDRFEVNDRECSGELAGGRSCEVTVIFDPAGVGESSATLVVGVEDGDRFEEVTLRAFGLG